MCISNIISKMYPLFLYCLGSRPAKPGSTHGYIHVGFHCLNSTLHIVSQLLLFQMHIVHLHFASQYEIKVQIFKDIYPPGSFKGIDSLPTLSPILSHVQKFSLFIPWKKDKTSLLNFAELGYSYFKHILTQWWKCFYTLLPWLSNIFLTGCIIDLLLHVNDLPNVTGMLNFH